MREMNKIKTNANQKWSDSREERKGKINYYGKLK